VSAAPTLGIAGVGLIGASIGLRAAAAGVDVVGWDPDPAHLVAARVVGAIARDVPDFATLARQVDTLVLAAPLDATLDLLHALVADPPRASLVLDVASVKTTVADVGRALRAFIATHPIAGSERSGPSAADATLFVDRVWTYDAAASRDLAARARAFIASMGARPMAIDSREHDRIVALTSHLPQVVSVALGARLGEHLDEPGVAALCGTGMASMLRLGSSAWHVWRAILVANGRPVAQEVRALANVLFSLAENLDAGRADELETTFAASADAVARLSANGPRSARVLSDRHVSDER
jgi:prephenate dehydrogenase